MKLSPFNASFASVDEKPVVWKGLHGSAFPLALLNAARSSNELILVLTRSAHQAKVLEQDLILFNDGSLPVIHFPDRETLPYDPFSAHPDITSERLGALAAIAGMKKGILILPATMLMQKLAPRTHVLGNSFDLAPGKVLDMEGFRFQLMQAGYLPSEQVYQSGQFAVRGSVIDLFPTGLGNPVRLDLFDNEIESIRLFDAETQRSEGKLDALKLVPARDYPSDSAAFESFRKNFRFRFAVDTSKVAIYQDLRKGNHPQGLEQYLPLFFEETESLVDYLPDAPRLVIQEGVESALSAFWDQIQERWEQRRHDNERPVLEPSELYFSHAQALGFCIDLKQVRWTDHALKGAALQSFDSCPAPDLHIHERGSDRASLLSRFDATFPGKIVYAADTPGRRELLADTLSAFSVRTQRFESFEEFLTSGANRGLLILPVEEGFIADGNFAVLTESQIFGGRARPKVTQAARERDPESIIRNLTDLDQGAPVVHEDHGIGRYQGLEVLEIDGRPAEFLMLEYAGQDKLYVPVSSLDLISRYTGSDPDSAPLHRLGSEQWAKARKRAAKKVRDVAAELLDLYSRRHSREGFGFTIDQKMYAEFSSGFPFEETPDQQRSIESVVEDMVSAKPMDRVVCGDVGFGKTEVALRAAFLAVQGGKQVALLVPTTLLAQQHFSTFSDRFADWPVRIELLSRFRSAKESNAVLAELQSGKVDLVIGTHRLIQKDIRFKRLGLVIIDEEQRFGVRQKERLKQLRAEVDLLTLTATPIPRTLNMAMSGIRDLSIIATPPERRMAVKTLVLEWDTAMLREAMQRELQRGGQVFFLHNEVRNIERIAREVAELAPDARIGIAHGQMKERELEKVMLDFYRQRFNVLVCTTIIENGIDVPTANTIIVNRADKFGLSQLHQLRGRVGRSHHRAYAYLVVPEKRSMTRDAIKRLDAIASLEELGAGFTLSTHDMEIRGAGELLGEDQSGQIQQIGFSLYSELLNRAVAALKEGKEPDLELTGDHGPDIELHVAALIPETYLGDVHSRLTLYKRIASASSCDELRELQVEMIDRFGLLPEPTKMLFTLSELKLKADVIGVKKVDLGERGGRIEFQEDARADAQVLLKLLHTHPAQYQLSGPSRLQIKTEIETGEERAQLIQELLEKLTPSDVE
jgi:transcription-repair coupling factor (superfamily II helicase)